MAQADDEKKLTEAIKALNKNVDEMDETLEKALQSQGYWKTFLKGIIGALGAAIGATLVLGIIVLILQKLAGAPFVGHYILTILQHLQQNK